MSDSTKMPPGYWDTEEMPRICATCMWRARLKCSAHSYRSDQWPQIALTGTCKHWSNGHE